MTKMNLNELNSFITVYFGQDYDLIDDSDEIAPKIDAFIADSHLAMKYGLIADIDLLLKEADNPEVEFRIRYGSDFDPHLWGTDALSFLKRVRDRISHSLNEAEPTGRQ
ncbi:contact-dependent growth inhibition system immunity protein [Klebsiella aerogenes]|uniref:contact-dependent growth inhibition system immunity protein n=1 Tax=Klebsiella aerogenes TaxID=548 RepID=UPI001908842F|nr:contact-dependent growth inhibition system immunity protein [Klebsiella aerogenes]MBK0468242.1 hypothetical protein [Klebsiella aerogenes]